MARPRKPEGTHRRTKIRSVRVPDDIWEAAQAEAARRGVTVSEVIVAFLEKFGRPQR